MSLELSQLLGDWNCDLILLRGSRRREQASPSSQSYQGHEAMFKLVLEKVGLNEHGRDIQLQH